MTSRDVEGAPAPAKRRRPWWQETLILAAIAVVAAIVMKAAVVQAFYIPSESMEPGLVKDDRILVQKVSYWGPGEPHRGDVVVFDDPGGWLPEPDGHLVKRVIGVAGDTVTCCDDDGRLEVNGQPLDEDGYIAPQDECNGPAPMGVLHCSWSVGPIPAGELFVMGDNRAHSSDSSARLCTGMGCSRGEEYVDTDLVVGRVFALVWPFDHATLLHRPATFDDVPDAD